MSNFNLLTILLTNRCPLNCKHCGPSSGPNEKDDLSDEVIENAIIYAKSEGASIVNFSGGEPFLLPIKLSKFIALCSEIGLISRITTSAYWGKNKDMALRVLQPLVEKGLNQLMISVSDPHQEQVPFVNIINACSVSYQLGVPVHLTIRMSEGSSTIEKIVERFNDAAVNVPPLFESPIIPFGRAKEFFFENELLLVDVNELSGPCRSITSHPTLHPNGVVTGCAVVFGQECKPLHFGNLNADSFSTVKDRMDNSVLASWIHNIGVVELKNVVEKDLGVVFKSRYANICHLCGELLSNPQVLEFLKEKNFLN